MLKKSGAFTCKNCPKHNDYENGGCPMWWEIVQENIDDPTQVKVEKGCGYQMLPQLMIEVIKSTDHTTNAAYSARNQMNTVAEAISKIYISNESIKQINM